VALVDLVDPVLTQLNHYHLAEWAVPEATGSTKIHRSWVAPDPPARIPTTLNSFTTSNSSFTQPTHEARGVWAAEARLPSLHIEEPRLLNLTKTGCPRVPSVNEGSNRGVPNLT